MDFGEKLQELRKENKMSQENLAEKINVSRQAISKWEQGIAIPDTDNIVRLSKFFQVPVEYLLLDDRETPEKDEPASKLVSEKTKTKNKRRSPGVLIISGLVVEIIAVCLAYVMQYFDMKVHGSFLTNALEYMTHLPVCLVVIAGIVCIFWGVCKLIEKAQDRHR